MRMLFINEWRKIVKQKLVWIFIIISCFYIFYNFLPRVLEETSFPLTATTKNNEKLTYKEGLHYNHEMVQKYKGQLTDDLIAKMIADYNLDSSRMEMGDALTPLDTVSEYLNRRFIYRNIQTVSEVYPQIDFPLYYGYSDFWESFAYDFSLIVQLIPFIVIISIAPIFSFEYQSGMVALILTSKNGRILCAKAKIMASLLFANLVTIVFLVFVGCLYFSYFGFEGWDTSIQIGSYGYFRPSPWEINFLHLFLQAFLLVILGTNLIAAVTILLSNLCKTNFLSVICSIFIYFGLNASFFTNSIENVVLRYLFCLLPINAFNISLVTTCPPIKIGNFKISYVYFIAAFFIIGTILLTKISLNIFNKQKNYLPK